MGFVSQGNPTIYRGDFIATYVAFKRTYSTGTSVAIWTRVHKATVSVAEKRKKQNITAVLGYLINKKKLQIESSNSSVPSKPLTMQLAFKLMFNKKKRLNI